MHDLVPRRNVVQQLGAVSLFSLAGCVSGRSADSPSSESAEIEPRETDPVQARGEPVTITHRVSSLGGTVLENGSVTNGTEGSVESLSSWASSQSVRVAGDALRNEVIELAEEYPDEPVQWNIQWEEAQSRFLITTTLTLIPPVDNVAWPSVLYSHFESSAPKTVTAVISSGERAVSHEFPVYVRAKLRSV